MNFQSEHTCVTGIQIQKEKSLSCPLQSHPMGNHSLTFITLLLLPVLELPIQNHIVIVFQVWLVSFRVMLLRFIPVVGCIHNSFPLVEQYLVICMYHHGLIQPPVKGHLGGFQCGIHSQHPVDGSGEIPTDKWLDRVQVFVILRRAWHCGFYHQHSEHLSNQHLKSSCFEDQLI